MIVVENDRADAGVRAVKDSSTKDEGCAQEDHRVSTLSSNKLGGFGSV